jgi:ATP-dependent Clp endopeptidase proteolytic subunit ClpP
MKNNLSNYINKKDKKKKEKEDKEQENQDAAMLEMLEQLAAEESKTNIIALYGDVTEEKCSELLYGMLVLRETSKKEKPADPDNPESEIVTTYEPFTFYISTFGGSAADMFSIYDMMRIIQEDGLEVETFGLGKVMSAGVLMLAAGTKGKRKIGKFCRVMIHSVSSGNAGSLHELENEVEEIKFTQRQYIKALSSETNMSEKYLRKLIDRKTNVYLTAEEAVELGIADEVV